MSDLVDVQNQLVTLISQILYPNGISGPTAPAITGLPTIVYPGWPTSAALDADLAALPCDGKPNTGKGKIHITVYPTKMERKTTRFKEFWQPVSKPVHTLNLVIAGQNVTVGGTVSAPQNVMLMVNRVPVVYAVQPNDTLARIATALAALIPGSASVDSTITLPATAVLTAARVGATVKAIKEIRRQERVFMICVWANTPTNRDAAIRVIDPVLANTKFIILPDTDAGRLIYKSSPVDDSLSKTGTYRRDLLYSVEYGTFLTETETEVTQVQTNVSSAVNGAPPFQPAATVFN